MTTHRVKTHHRATTRKIQKRRQKPFKAAVKPLTDRRRYKREHYEYLEDEYNISEIGEILHDANTNLHVVHPRIIDWLTKKEMTSNSAERLQEIKMSSQQKREEGWAEDTIQAYEKIEARSLYPLCPPSWKDYYLPLWSKHLFCKTDEEAYLRTVNIAQSSGKQIEIEQHDQLLTNRSRWPFYEDSLSLCSVHQGFWQFQVERAAIL
jgi:hypothetical protein